MVTVITSVIFVQFTVYFKVHLKSFQSKVNMIVTVVSNTIKCFFFCFPGNSRTHARAPTWKAQKRHSPIHPLIHSSPSHTNTWQISSKQTWSDEDISCDSHARAHSTFCPARPSSQVQLLEEWPSRPPLPAARPTPRPQRPPVSPPPAMSHVCTWTASNLVPTDLMMLQREGIFVSIATAAYLRLVLGTWYTNLGGKKEAANTSYLAFTWNHILERR